MYISFQRAPQGSAAGPTLWGRLAAVVMRLTQSLFDPNAARLICYVDDPLAAIRGTLDEQRATAALMILVWSALGFKLAFPKGQLSHVVHWIGGTIKCTPTAVRASIKESIVSDILVDLKRVAKQNYVTKKELHSLIGKINHCAGLLLAIRPFLHPLWAALADKKHSGAPRECIWRQQIAIELDWFELFFTGRGLAIERVFTIEASCAKALR